MVAKARRFEFLLHGEKLVPASPDDEDVGVLAGDCERERIVVKARTQHGGGVIILDEGIAEPPEGLLETFDAEFFACECGFV